MNPWHEQANQGAGGKSNRLKGERFQLAGHEWIPLWWHDEARALRRLVVIAQWCPYCSVFRN